MSTKEKFQLVAAIPESGNGRPGEPGWKRVQLNLIAPNGRVGVLNRYDVETIYDPGYYMIETEWGNRNGKLEKVVVTVEPVTAPVAAKAGASASS